MPQSRRLIAWQAKGTIDTGALGHVLNTTIPTFASLWQSRPIKGAHINKPTVGADLISTTVPHALDPLCFLHGEFRFLSATSTAVFPTVQSMREDG
ncbi:hypothetical protein JMJ35_007420 [Cladonia borealis]|uniref:Gal80p-like C-terminal domain-containing protein n=1 Tax=Cladonia borealis TaxID=184061 RepID=A0AA39U864_9LECA|nr:hypothetical protein JMJ35_007420 [Cladonia borealis]